MTKADIIDQIYEKTGLPKKDVAVVVESVFAAMRGSMIKREPIYLRGFGTFGIKHRAAKTGRNISKGTTIQIEARDMPIFKPSKQLLSEMHK